MATRLDPATHTLAGQHAQSRDAHSFYKKAKIGELLMENDLLYAKVDQLEAAGPLARRRSRR